MGCSVAYHLAKLGWTDVLLLERDQITSGTTWHAAGLMVTFGSLSEPSTEMRKYSKELYSHVLEEETGMSTGFMPVGFISLATTPGYLEARARQCSPSSRRPSADPDPDPVCTAGVPARCGVQPQVRSRRARDLGSGGAAPLPAVLDRRHHRRLLRAGRRASQPGRRH